MPTNRTAPATRAAQADDLHAALDAYHGHAHAALAQGQMAAFRRWGALYHDTADRLAALTGIDPRPQA